MHVLASFLKEEYQQQTIYPPENVLFNALNLCDFDKLKVVILGQGFSPLFFLLRTHLFFFNSMNLSCLPSNLDPYHGPGQAHGLCFSVPPGVDVPPSLKNIYKEINQDVGANIPTSGNLEHWAKQGI